LPCRARQRAFAPSSWPGALGISSLNDLSDGLAIKASIYLDPSYSVYTSKLMGWEDIIAIIDAEEKDALAQKRAAMLDELPYSK
jgi:hypothetical protein